MSLGEFDLINQHFNRPVLNQSAGVSVGIGDDCAILDIPDGYQLAVSTDTLVSGIHFFEDVDPYRLGYKSLAVNLSDLAAMGATPKWISLAITLPDTSAINNQTWLSEFSRGFFDLANKHQVSLVGGDTTKGPLSITVSVKGLIPRGQALQRNNAKANDLICVSSHLGDGALGLALKLEQLEIQNQQYFVDALELTEPRILLGESLRGLASSCIDISDGLTQDLQHILKASHCSAQLNIESLPLSKEMLAAVDLNEISEDMAIQYALTGGDDYELLFTISDAHLVQLNKQLACQEQVTPAISIIGQLHPQQAEPITLLQHNQAVNFFINGWDHFK
ncbi:MAG: thiamine-phosphate kinase [Psychromonas sp.]